MREIKFRGKISGAYKGNDPLNNWFYGDLVHELSTGRCFILDVAHTDMGEARFNKLGMEVIPETVGEHTGLKDKNGKEIYEGDILKFSDVDTAIVKWNKEYASFIVKPSGDYYFDDDILGKALYYNKDIEVIGNIYEGDKK